MPIANRVIAALLLAAPLHSPAQNKEKGAEPVTWGALSGNTSCVIFAEGRKTSGRFYGVAVTTRTVGKLTLIEAQNYTFPQKELLETQENIDNLTRMAQRDRVKFVKIPEKYSPELLEQARQSCKSNSQQSSSPGPALQ